MKNTRRVMGKNIKINRYELNSIFFIDDNE